MSPQTSGPRLVASCCISHFLVIPGRTEGPSLESMIALVGERAPRPKPLNPWLWIPGSRIRAPRNDGVSPQIQLLEKVVALVVDNNKGREIFKLYYAKRLHS